MALPQETNQLYGNLYVQKKSTQFCTFTVHALSVKNLVEIAKIAIIFETITQKKINTVHNLITFSIVFTNKIGLDRVCPPPSKLRCIYPPPPPIKTKVNAGRQQLIKERSYIQINSLTLVLMGGLQTLVLMGGGGSKCPPYFYLWKQ